MFSPVSLWGQLTSTGRRGYWSSAHLPGPPVFLRNGHSSAHSTGSPYSVLCPTWGWSLHPAPETRPAFVWTNTTWWSLRQGHNGSLCFGWTLSQGACLWNPEHQAGRKPGPPAGATWRHLGWQPGIHGWAWEQVPAWPQAQDTSHQGDGSWLPYSLSPGTRWCCRLECPSFSTSPRRGGQAHLPEARLQQRHLACSQDSLVLTRPHREKPAAVSRALTTVLLPFQVIQKLRIRLDFLFHPSKHKGTPSLPGN